MPTQSIYNNVLYPYQKEAAKRIADQQRILLADQPGLGKTLEVLGALELGKLFDKPANILILTPIINAQTTWKDSIERWVQPSHKNVQLIDVSKGQASHKEKQFAKLGETNIVLANHNAIDKGTNGMRVKGIGKLTYDAIIVDESHMVLPIRDTRKLTNFREGLHDIPMRKDAWLIAVSGTPDRGKLENRYGTWLFLDMKNVPTSRWVWLERNFYISERQVSRTKKVKAIGTLKNREAWLAKDKAMMIL
jgi:superfamily II DNA or RNA helicase